MGEKREEERVRGTADGRDWTRVVVAMHVMRRLKSLASGRSSATENVSLLLSLALYNSALLSHLLKIPHELLPRFVYW